MKVKLNDLRAHISTIVRENVEINNAKKKLRKLAALMPDVVRSKKSSWQPPRSDTYDVVINSIPMLIDGIEDNLVIIKLSDVDVVLPIFGERTQYGLDDGDTDDWMAVEIRSKDDSKGLPGVIVRTGGEWGHDQFAGPHGREDFWNPPYVRVGTTGKIIATDTEHYEYLASNDPRTSSRIASWIARAKAARDDLRALLTGEFE